MKKISKASKSPKKYNKKLPNFIDIRKNGDNKHNYSKNELVNWLIENKTKINLNFIRLIKF